MQNQYVYWKENDYRFEKDIQQESVPSHLKYDLEKFVPGIYHLWGTWYGFAIFFSFSFLFFFPLEDRVYKISLCS